MDTESQQCKELREKYRNYTTRTFWFAFELIFIFGVPAFIAVFFIKQNGNNFLWLLVVTFVFSWVVTIIRWKKIKKHTTDLEQKMIEVCGPTPIIKDDEDENDEYGK